ncbi:MAG: copper resistance protein NlpE N-terminal domain-containing protein [Woeseiaceae bacterium]|nr:copper resistance protein NlpE N-terminal domain-containing protein [Woeseiaceae bacterium]
MIRPLVLFVLVVAAGCGGDQGVPPAEELSDDTLPGVYGGAFPCDGCAAIETTLWLRPDGRFFFEQRYPPRESVEAMDVYSLGVWRTLPDETAIELVGSGPRRIFERADRDTLSMRTESDLEFLLSRAAAKREFSAALRMSGTVRIRDDSFVFTECLTGIVVPVRKTADYRSFQHQYRSIAGRGSPTFVELVGRFSWSHDGAPLSLTIERFITVRAEESC